VFENRVLRGILEPKRDEITGRRIHLHNQELHNLYSSPNIIKWGEQTKKDMGKKCSMFGIYREMYTRTSGEKSEGRTAYMGG
jgi:hypothetical protein